VPPTVRCGTGFSEGAAPAEQKLSSGSAQALALGSPALAENSDGEFNAPGNCLIADQFNNRVIEVDPDGTIVWQFGKGTADFSADSIIRMQ
jgi:hypothetical protein